VDLSRSLHFDHGTINYASSLDICIFDFHFRIRCLDNCNILHDFYYIGGKQYSKAALRLRRQMLRANRFAHGTELEIVWTILPSIILLLIAVPSFTLLYAMEGPTQASLTVKAIGHQWYWQYEMVNVKITAWPERPYYQPWGRSLVHKFLIEEHVLAMDSNMTYDDELRLRRS